MKKEIKTECKMYIDCKVRNIWSNLKIGTTSLQFCQYYIAFIIHWEKILPIHMIKQTFKNA